MRTSHKTSHKKFRLSGEESHYRSSFSRKHYRKHHRRPSDEVFKCRHCRRFIGPLPSGGQHRNHCPFCLYSRHVDGQQTGDRLSSCGSKMQPIGSFQRRNGEHVLVHRCLGCGFERFNRIAADDDFDLVLSLPSLSPRTRREVKARWLEELLTEQQEQEYDSLAYVHQG